MKRKMTWLLAGLLAGGNVMAADIEATLYPGQSTNSSVSVTLPSLPPAADVLFSFDCTASMGGVLATAESNAVSLVASLAATGVSFHFGVASFMDYPATYNSCGYSNTYGDATSGDYPYRLNQAMTTNIAAVTAAMNTLYIGYGVDGPEDYTRALYESYADTNVTWRSGAKRVMVNFGDSVPHDCNLNQGIPGTGGAVFSTGGDPGRDGIMGTSDDLVLLDVLAGMASNHVVLLAARLDDFGGGDYAFNYWTNWTAITGGKAFQSTNTTLIRDLMNEITNSLTIACVDNLHPVIEPPSFSSWLTITPPAYAQICSGDIGIFNLGIAPPLGTPAGDYSFTLSMVDAQAVDYADKTVLIHVLPTVPLPVALNNNTLTWVTAPSLPWFGQTGVSHDSVASGRSFFIGDGQQSTLTTTTNGPGTFSFWWKVSSQTNADMLSFLSYGGGITNPPTQISGETGWNQLRLLLGGGLQTLVWTYTKDASQSAGLDAGFVDQVSYVFGPTLPFIIANPVSQAVSAGTPVTFSVLADGTPVLAYQWRLNSTDIPGATSNVFALPVPGDNDAGIYSVRVFDPYGTTNSAEASLTIIPLILGGDNSQGQTDIPAGATNVVAVAAGAWHSLGLRANGSVLAWGDDNEGQCNVPAGLSNVLAIAGGGYHSLAIQADETVVAWGANDYAQTTVPAGLAHVIGISAGTWHNLALRSDGTVKAWGDNSWGQSSVPAGLSNVLAIAAGGNHSLALRTNGTVVAWGENTDADGNVVGQSVVPSGLTGVVAIAAGDYHSLAVRSNGTVVAWGDDSQGQIDVPPGLSNVVAVACGGAHSLALKADGTMAAWGANWSGQCSLASTVVNVVGLAGGEEHSLLLVTHSLPIPKLLNPLRTPSTFSFLIQTMYRKHYALDFKNSLSATNWSTVSTNAGNGALELLTDRAATAAQRFYRLRQW
jgi:Regulator of chromosome condensation (RCC1) repeat